MIKVRILQNYALYFYFFFVNFQELKLFGIEGFSVPKFTLLFYLCTILLDYKKFLQKRDYQGAILPLILLFILLTIINLLNINNVSQKIIDITLFQNLVIFWLLINHGRLDISVMEKALFSLTLGSTLLAIFYNLDIGTSMDKGRVILFGDNSNITSIRMVISTITLLYFILKDRLKFGVIRWFLLLPVLLMAKLVASTGSRVGFISLVLSLFVLVLFSKTKHFYQKIGFVFIGSLFVLYLLRTILNEGIIARRLLQTAANQDLSGREDFWSEILITASENLFFGIGQSGYFMSFGNASPHNVIIEVLIYTGLVGVLFYLLFLYKIVIFALKSFQRNDLILPILLLSPIFGTILSGQILEMKLGWLLFAYIISLYLSNLESSSTKNIQPNYFRSNMKIIK